MKFFYLFSIVIIISACTNTSKPIQNIEEPTMCDCNELILDIDYQRFYLSDKKQPFTGHCITLKPNGKKVFERDYLEGKYHGLVIVYHNNGEIKSTTQYDKNLMTGDQKIYSLDGYLISHAVYLRSQLKEIIK